MIKRIWRPSPRLSLLVLATLFVSWVFRSKLEHLLAPDESDYTDSSDLSAQYPRPDADLTPVWKVKLEPGYGGAAIDGQDVFVLDRKPGTRDTLRVFDLDTGAERWTFGYAAPGRLEFTGSRTTPAVTKDLVYVSGSFGQVHCIDRGTHALRWRRELGGDCGGVQPDFGWAASPLIVGDLVILPALGPEVGLIAFDRFSGETRWQTDGLGHSHSTPVVLDLLGETQVVFLSSEVQGLGAEGPAPTTISAFNPVTGAKLWRFTTPLTSVPIPPPVQVDGERFFLTGGYGGGSSLIHLRREDGKIDFEVVFHVSKGSQLHPPVVHDGHIYLVANENSNDSRRKRHRGGLTCFDMQGDELWSTGADPYFGRGHVISLGDHLLIQDGLSGMLRLCLASPEGYSQVATANVFESPPKANKRMWATMAYSGGTFVVRGQDELRCVRLGG